MSLTPSAESVQPAEVASLSLCSLILSSNSTDRTQTGHVLGDPQQRDVVTCDRGLPPVVFILIRLLTHLALLLGASQSSQV